MTDGSLASDGRAAARRTFAALFVSRGMSAPRAQSKAHRIVDDFDRRQAVHFARARKRLRLARKILGERIGEHQRDIIRARRRRCESAGCVAPGLCRRGRHNRRT